MPSPSDYQRALSDHKSRNKQNQRNFRERRQQRISELEDKLRYYETSQVSATQEVQRAARVVAAENAMLRDILRRRLGISDADILAMRRDWVQRNLDGHDDTNGRSKDWKTSGNGATESKSGLQMGQRISMSETTGNGGPLCSASCAGTNATGQTEIQSSVSSAEPVAELCATRTRIPTAVDTGNGLLPSKSPHSGDAAQQIEITSLPSSIEPILRASKPTSLPSHEELLLCQNSNGSRPVDSVASMSCERAAEILSSLRSQDEMSDVRARLGCTSDNTCTITNVHVMEVMSEDI